MPDTLDVFNKNYWTSMSRLGCSGKIKNCFSNQTSSLMDEIDNTDYDFWTTFDRTDSGACVALQTTPLMDLAHDYVQSYLGPVFSSCGNLNHLACEGKGPRSKYVDEIKITVNRTLFILEGNT